MAASWQPVGPCPAGLRIRLCGPYSRRFLAHRTTGLLLPSSVMSILFDIVMGSYRAEHELKTQEEAPA
jgi:hypothetical protein